MMIEQAVLGLVSGTFVGLALGATGGGGSLLAIPLLVYLLGVKVQPAAAMSLVVVGASALLGVYQRRDSGDIRLKAALVFSIAGAAGAWVGAFGHRLVSEETVLLLFGLVMMAAARSMWRRGRQPDERLAAEPCAERFARACVVNIILIGLGVGALTGFFGVGGGFLIVPTLVLVLKVPMRAAVGTSLLIIALIAVGGLLGHLQAGDLDWPLTGLLLVGSLIGMTAGTKAAEFASPLILTRGFAVLAAGVAGMMMLHSGMKLFAGLG